MFMYMMVQYMFKISTKSESRILGIFTPTNLISNNHDLWQLNGL